MNKAWIAGCFAVFANCAGAETIYDAYGLAEHTPRPEEWTKIDETLSIRAQILNARTGEVMPELAVGQKLRLGLDFYVQPGAEDRDITLTCSVYFMDALAETRGTEKRDVPCYSGRLFDGLESFQPIDFPVTYRARMGDAAGSWALVVRVTDTVINDGISLAPTFRIKP